MLQTLRNDIARALALLSMMAGAVSCSGPERREADVRDNLQRSTLPMSLLIDVVTGEPEEGLQTYGAEEQWEEMVAGVFEELHVTEEVSYGSAGRRPDLKLVVKIDPGDDSTETRGDAAFLDVLAWITIPFLPLWIDDVDVRPGLNVTFRLQRRVDGDEYEDVDESEDEPGEIATCMLDRHPLFSWWTATVLLVPPFVHQHGDPDHLESTIGPAVRREVAVRAASFVEARGRDDVLTDLSLKPAGGGWMLSGQAGGDIGLLRFSVDEVGFDRERVDTGVLHPSRDMDEPFELPIDLDVVGDGDYLRIETLSRSNGSKRYYTKRLPPTRAPPAVLTARAD